MENYISLLILLLILFDPVGNSALILSILKNQTAKERRIIIIRENFIAMITLMIFIFIGDYLLAVLNLSPPALAISGGVVLFLIALRMVFPTPNQEAEEYQHAPLVVPIAIPLIAGPASLTTVLLFSKQYPTTTLIIAVAVAILINTIFLLFAEVAAKVLGKAGMNAVERLIGLVLITMSIQMMINGLKTAFSL